MGGLIIAFLNSWQIAFVALATGPIIIAAGRISNVFFYRFQENLQDANDHAASVAKEVCKYVNLLWVFTYGI